MPADSNSHARAGAAVWCDEADRFQFAAVVYILLMYVKQLELLRGKQPAVR